MFPLHDMTDITYLFVATQNQVFTQDLKSKLRMLKMRGFMNFLMQTAIHTLLSKN